jgi:8-oxo-dGTP pyrophosphatase MutT (NUDIX family)
MGVTVPGVESFAGTSASNIDRFSLARIARALRERKPRAIEGITNAAAVALILRSGTAGPEALFIKRAEHPNDPWSGHIGLPGGRAESHDAGLVYTAIRETEEEIGLTLSLSRDFLGPLDETRATARAKAIDMKIAAFAFSIDDAPRTLTLNEEVAATHWVPLIDLFDSSRAAAVTMEREGQTYRFPAIGIQGLTIWGLTLRMLRNFETLVSRA